MRCRRRRFPYATENVRRIMPFGLELQHFDLEVTSNESYNMAAVGRSTVGFQLAAHINL